MVILWPSSFSTAPSREEKTVLHDTLVSEPSVTPFVLTFVCGLPRKVATRK